MDFELSPEIKKELSHLIHNRSVEVQEQEFLELTKRVLAPSYDSGLAAQKAKDISVVEGLISNGAKSNGWLEFALKVIKGDLS